MAETPDRGRPGPQSREAAYGEASAVLSAGATELRLFRRTTGWGWAELVVDGRLLATLDHFGELKAADQVVPMRLEADEIEQLDERHATFVVASVDVARALDGSSFDGWIGAPHAGPLLTGTVEIMIDADESVTVTWKLTSGYDVGVDYFRGPWLRIPDQGAERHNDAIVPGVDWPCGSEWSSGTDYFADPWAMRATPPPSTVTAPIMAVHRDGRTVSLEWDPRATATGWFSLRREQLQPVFAAPNFIERRPGALMGLMIPQVDQIGRQWQDTPRLELHRGQRIDVAGTIRTGPGPALSALVGWAGRTGFPPPDAAPDGPEAVIERIASAYATRFWHPGQGYGLGQVEGDIRPSPPEFVRQYIRDFPGTGTAATLNEQLESLPRVEDAGVVPRAEELLAAQRTDGSFVFDPEGRHRSKDDFVVARDLVAPMAFAGDTALDLTVEPAIQLLAAADAGGEERYAIAARRALESALDAYRPEGGDYWETPLHAPNLLAAGHAAVAYALGHRRFGDERYQQRARHWLRTLLAFTHLWEPATGLKMIYNTKPCLCASDWYYAHWVRDHVQWEVLESFALADRHGVDLAACDPELDWRRYRAGITWAAVRWLLDHRRDDWRPHNLPDTLDDYRAGRFDLCLPDTHNSTTGLYGGMAILPGTVGLNLLALRRQGPFDKLRARNAQDARQGVDGPQ